MEEHENLPFIASLRPWGGQRSRVQEATRVMLLCVGLGSCTGAPPSETSEETGGSAGETGGPAGEDGDVQDDGGANDSGSGEAGSDGDDAGTGDLEEEGDSPTEDGDRGTDETDGGANDTAAEDAGSGSADLGTGDGATDSGEDEGGKDDGSASDSGGEEDGSVSEDSGGGEDGTTDESGEGSAGDDAGACVEDGDCNGRTPYCEAGRCVGCEGLTSSTCAARDPANPVCRETGGVCVECTSESDERCRERGWVCGESNICHPCSEHEQCETACDLSTKQCIDEAPLHVDNVTCVGGTETGTAADPFCTIGAAVTAIPDVGPGVVIVHAGSTYEEAVVIGGSKVVALLGEDMPVLQETAGAIITVQGEGTLYASGLQLGGGASTTGGFCDGGSLRLDDSAISQSVGDGIAAYSCLVHLRRTSITDSGGDSVRANGGTLTMQDVTISTSTAGHGVNASGGTVILRRVAISGSGSNGVNMIGAGTLTLEEVGIAGSGGWGVSAVGSRIIGARTQVLDNDAGGISLGDSDLTMDTSIIGGNGGNGLVDTTGLLADGSGFELSYVTLAGNLGSELHRSIRCTNGGTGTLRNSIAVTSGDAHSVDCAGLTVVTSAVQDPEFAGDSMLLGPWNGVWFRDAGSNDYHLGPGRDVFDGAATWEAGDPVLDIDGDPRPTTRAGRDWPGADVPASTR